MTAHDACGAPNSAATGVAAGGPGNRGGQGEGGQVGRRYGGPDPLWRIDEKLKIPG